MAAEQSREIQGDEKGVRCPTLVLLVLGSNPGLPHIPPCRGSLINVHTCCPQLPGGEEFITWKKTSTGGRSAAWDT